MPRRRTQTVIAGIVAIVATAAVAGAFALAFEHACPPERAATSATSAPGTDTGHPATMRAVRLHCYGGPATLHVQWLPVPTPSAHQVLVQVHVAATNPLDWHELRGQPYVMRLDGGFGRPKRGTFGADFAGVIAAIGDSVTRFAVGDTVFGATRGAFAEWLAIRETGDMAHVPSGVSPEQAAALPVAGSTALQAVRDQGRVTSGMRVLVNGASGGVGHLAVQLAALEGAHVTGVASSRNLDFVRSLGASAVIDYTATDFTKGTSRYDVIIDLVGNHPPSALRRALVPGGRVVIVGGPDHDRWLGPARGMLRAAVDGWFVPETFVPLFAETRSSELARLAARVADGTLHVAIDRRFALDAIADAITWQAQGRSRGKNLVLVR